MGEVFSAFQRTKKSSNESLPQGFLCTLCNWFGMKETELLAFEKPWFARRKPWWVKNACVSPTSQHLSLCIMEVWVFKSVLFVGCFCLV